MENREKGWGRAEKNQHIEKSSVECWLCIILVYI